MRAHVLLALVAGVGCAHRGTRGMAPEAIESAYLQARRPHAVCNDNDVDCCAERAGDAQVAAVAGESARAAELWHRVALACPSQRLAAGAAVLAASRLGPEPVAPQSRVINVTYRVRLSPSIRLFWVATVVGHHLLPMAAPASAATQPVRVEVHAIRFAAGKAGPLLTVTRQLDLAFGEGTIVTVDIAESDGAGPQAEPLAIRAQVDRLPAPRARPAPPPSPPAKRPPPALEPARALHLAPLRAPLELGAPLRAVRPALRLCLDREGELDSVRFLEPAHPRLAASVLDMLRDSRHEPYRVGDLAVPSCETTPRS